MNRQTIQPIGAKEYDRLWGELDDFIRLNPGARHRRRWLIEEIGRASCRERV